MGCAGARNPSHFMFIDFLMSYQFQLLVFSSNVFERPFLLTVDCVDGRTYSQRCFTLQQKKARHVQHLRTSRVSWSYHDLSFRSWCQALCLGSQAIRINKESNISNSILVQRKTFASEKCFFFPSICPPYFPLLPPCSFLSIPFCILLPCSPTLIPYTATPRKASLSSYRGLERNARSHWQGQSLAEKAGETLPFQNQGKQKIFKQYSKNILVAFKSFACHIYMCNYMWFPHLLK